MIMTNVPPQLKSAVSAIGYVSVWLYEEGENGERCATPRSLILG